MRGKTAYCPQEIQTHCKEEAPVVLLWKIYTQIMGIVAVVCTCSTGGCGGWVI